MTSESYSWCLLLIHVEAGCSHLPLRMLLCSYNSPFATPRPQPETAKGHSRQDSSTTAIATETPLVETQGSGGVDSAATGGAASRKGGAKSGSTPGKGGKAASGPGSARSTRSSSTSFHPERLDCLKRHEEALRKRQEAVKKARDEEGEGGQMHHNNQLPCLSLD